MGFDKIAHLILGLSFVCILLTLVAIGAQAREDALPQPDPVVNSEARATDNPVHDLIRKQLGAIRQRDADLAWAVATDKFHEKYDTAKEFLAHLRLKLRPVYNHKNFEFLDQTDTGNGIIQKVKMKERNGDAVTVIYRLTQQDGGEWLIESFAVPEPEADPV